MRITVVGGGVSGLTTALRLRQDGHEADIVTAARHPHTTSIYAAAIWWPVMIEPQEVIAPIALDGLRTFEQLAADGVPGIRIMQISEYSARPITPGPWTTGVTGLRMLGPEDVPEPYVAGVTITAPRIDPTVYLPWLEQQLDDSGATIELLETPLGSLEPLFDAADVVVNCTGLGARTLVRDTSLYPIRGQVVAIDDPSVDEGRVDEIGDRDLSYVFPREREVIVGGTFWYGDWSTVPDDRQTERILHDVHRLYPGIDTSRVREVRVGLRPGRPTPRIEAEHTEHGPVIHNYGHAGNGYTLSWGSAARVSALVDALP
jgi:D-amino-acid oxidase